jgi:hypothetical protein
MAQVYDYYLNRKRNAIEYYEKYLSAQNANIMMDGELDSDSGRLMEIVRSRIDHLKEDLSLEK